MKIIYVISAIIFILIAGCEEDASYLFDSSQSILVVDGMITNTPADNYVRLNLTDIDTIIYDRKLIKRVPVNDALVIVSDNLGHSETLSVSKDLDYISFDSVLNGLYPIRTLKGFPGRTYSLYIKYQNKEYTAESFMQAVPEIDSLYYDKIYDPVKFEYYYPPLISFNDPQDEKNYYLFGFAMTQIEIYYNLGNYQNLQGNHPLQATIINDDYLSHRVSGLDVSKGYSPDWWINGYTWAIPGDSVYINMYSLSREGYNFWKSIIEQIESEGGIFNPAPATPSGNISNGALGLFQASAVSSIKGQIPKDIGDKQ